MVKPCTTTCFFFLYGNRLPSFAIIYLPAPGYKFYHKPWISRLIHGHHGHFGNPRVFHLVGRESEHLLVQPLRGQGIFPQDPWIWGSAQNKNARFVSISYRYPIDILEISIGSPWFPIFCQGFSEDLPHDSPWKENINNGFAMIYPWKNQNTSGFTIWFRLI